MIVGRRTTARLANAGLVVAGVALLAALTLDVAVVGAGVSQRALASVFPPLLALGALAAARLIVSSRHTGLEARLASYWARVGLPPRDAAASPRSATRTGAFLGGAVGLVAAAVDLTHFFLTAPPPSPSGSLGVAIVAVGILVNVSLLAVLGAFLGRLGLAVLSRVQRGSRPGRYDTGRATVVALVALTPWVYALLAPGDAGSAPPSVRLTAATAGVLAALVTFGLLPAAAMRARGGQWGLAIASGVPILIGLALLAAGALGNPPALRGERTGDRPNVLLVTMPGLRADATGAFSVDARPTVYLDKLAETGSRLLSAITPHTSHALAAASLLAGRYVEQDTVQSGGPTLPDLLAEHGYQTGGFVSCACIDRRKARLGESFASFGDALELSDWLERLAFGALWQRHRRADPESTRGNADVVTDFRTWLSAVGHGPWIAWIDLADAAHASPAAGDEALQSLSPERFQDLDAPLPVAPAFASLTQRRAPTRDWINGYALAVTSADNALGAIEETLAARGELARTLIVVTAEFGVTLGEGGTWFESDASAAEPVLHVPLVFHGPGVATGAVVAGPCSLVDVLPTVVGLLGLASGQTGAALESEGEDLSRFLRSAGDQPVRSPATGPVFSQVGAPPGSGAGPVHVVRFGPWKLVRSPGGRESLYQIQEGTEVEIVPLGAPGRIHQEMSDILAKWLQYRSRGARSTAR